LVPKGVWDTGANQLEAGAWIENDDYDSLRETTQLFVKDTCRKLDSKLAIEAGIKSLSIDYKLSGYRDFADYTWAASALTARN